MVKMYVPLQFFFSKKPGLALPLIALQYHEVVIDVKLKNVQEVLTNNNSKPVINSMLLYGNYIFLDHNERKLMAQNKHEYLIEQVQRSNPLDAKQNNHELIFNHPIKELIWIFKRNNTEPMDFEIPIPQNSQQPVDYSLIVDPPKRLPWFDNCTLLLNGIERFSPRDANYFKLIQPFQHHTRIPSKSIYTYSFSLKPEYHQPTGACNFSRLDNTVLKLQPTSHVIYGDTLFIFATNYNILRIMGGMGGMMFSN